jgi:hypothetical protein
VLAAQIAGEAVRGLGETGIEDDLGDAFAVAQIDEHEAAVIAVVRDPAGQDHACVDIGRAEGTTGVGPLVRLQEAGHGRGNISRCVNVRDRPPLENLIRASTRAHAKLDPIPGSARFHVIPRTCEHDPISTLVDNLIHAKRGW